MSVVARTTVAISRRRSGIDVGNLKTVKRGERVEHEKFSGYRDLRSMIVDCSSIDDLRLSLRVLLSYNFVHGFFFFLFSFLGYMKKWKIFATCFLCLVSIDWEM